MNRYFLLRFPEGKPKAVTFSYDDGCENDPRFAETLTKHNLKGTFNINSGHIWGNDSWRIGVEDIKKYILDNGHEIAVHGEYHKAPGIVSGASGIKDVLNCRLQLEKTFGMIIRGMAYPDSGIRVMQGDMNYETIRNYLSALGIVYSRTLGGDNNSFSLPTDWLAWMPTAHHDNPEILDWIDEFNAFDYEKIRSSNRRPRLFYIWGHSYEFERNNNWEHLEEICERIKGKDDVWYATNIEIYEYCEAFSKLVFSADETMMYNPTLKKLWLDIEGVPYTIEPGETITIK
jgi:peptidoglycan/xylan/chitin deacetylase (PgdA/CDA1 family)